MSFFHSRKRGCPSGDALRLSCSVSGLPLSLYWMTSLIPLSLLWASYSSLGVRGCTFDSPSKFIMCPISLSWLESDNNQIASPFCWASNASTVALIQSSSTSSVQMSIYSSICILDSPSASWLEVPCRYLIVKLKSASSATHRWPFAFRFTVVNTYVNGLLSV